MRVGRGRERDDLLGELTTDGKRQRAFSGGAAAAKGLRNREETAIGRRGGFGWAESVEVRSEVAVSFFGEVRRRRHREAGL